MYRKILMLLFLINLFIIARLIINAPTAIVKYGDNPFNSLKYEINNIKKNADVETVEMRKKILLITVDKVDKFQRSKFRYSLRNNNTLSALSLFNTVVFLVLFMMSKKQNKQ